MGPGATMDGALGGPILLRLHGNLPLDPSGVPNLRVVRLVQVGEVCLIPLGRRISQSRPSRSNTFQLLEVSVALSRARRRLEIFREVTKEPVKTEGKNIPVEVSGFGWANRMMMTKKGQVTSVPQSQSPSTPNTLNPDDADDGAC